MPRNPLIEILSLMELEVLLKSAENDMLGLPESETKKVDCCAKNLFICPILLGLQSRRTVRACCCVSSCMLSVVSPRPLVGVDTPGLGLLGGGATKQKTCRQLAHQPS